MIAHRRIFRELFGTVLKFQYGAVIQLLFIIDPSEGIHHTGIVGKQFPCFPGKPQGHVKLVFMFGQQISEIVCCRSEAGIDFKRFSVMLLRKVKLFLHIVKGPQQHVRACLHGILFKDGFILLNRLILFFVHEIYSGQRIICAHEIRIFFQSLFECFFSVRLFSL